MNIYTNTPNSVKGCRMPIAKRILMNLGLLTALLIMGTAAVSAQEVTIKPQGKTLSQIVPEITEQTGMQFSYDLELNKTIVSGEGTLKGELNTILDKLFAGTGVKYTISGNRIFLARDVKKNVNGTPQQSPSPQQKRISGTVTDSENNPLAGATVVVVGQNAGTITDANGKYSLNVEDKKARLQFSYMGYVTQEVNVESRPVIDVVLKEDINLMDDVVVIGYGTLEKRAVTSSITSISGKDIPVGMGGSTFASALQGKISGMTINETSSPNSGIGFQLRGVASINASASPLVVVDGVPGADMASLNQEDILSIDVLKDASAGAIYGTRAAGGVILITTKQANEGPIKITYTGEISTEQVMRRPEVLRREDYLRYGLGSDMGHDTDWYNELLNEWAPSHRHVVNLQGGSRHARIYGTFMHQNQKGIAVGDNRKDYSGRINGNFSMFDNIVEIKMHSEYRQAIRDQRAGSDNFNQALRVNPTLSPYDPDSNTGYNVWTGGATDYNPVANIMLKQRDLLNAWLIADATLKLNFTDYLSAQGTVGYQYRTWKYVHYTSAEHRNSLDHGRTGTGYHAFNNTGDISFEGTVNFNKRFNKHNVSAVVGYSFWERNSDNFSMTNHNFPVDGVGAWDMGSGTFLSDGDAEMDSYKSPRERLIAFFGRANYSYDDRYMITASLRHEGSSKFGRDHRWGNFWAVSGGWRISKENFMKSVKWIDDLKVRVGYGVTGNNGFASGQSTRMYDANSMWYYGGEWIIAYGSKLNVNYNLHWERKSELNVGIDYSFLGNRLYGKFDYYIRKVDGMIYEIDVPVPPAIHSKTTMNYGDLQNTGWELEIGGVPVQTKNFMYSTSVRLSGNRSKITSLWGNNTYQDRVEFPSPGSPGHGGRLEEGTVIGSYFIWKHAGFSEDGKWLVFDKNDDVILASNKTYEDKRYIGNAIPKAIIAWENNFQYKNWSLGINFRAWLKYDVFNTIDMYYGLSTVEGQNVLRNAFIENRHIKEEKQLTDYWLEDGSFLKIDAISLGYTLDMKKYQRFIDKIHFYATVRNVACITGYSGLDPEVNINGLDPGYEWFNSIYPKTRRYTFGAQILF